MDPLTIRPARAEDLDALVRLLEVLFSIEADFEPEAARQRRGLALMLDDPARRIVLVAARGREIVGMVTGQLVVSTAEGALSAWIEDLVVDASARLGGVGSALLEAISARARCLGATRLQLVADRDNAPALAFYARMGWRATRLVCLRGGGA
jgi:ribosomal protein S18 acetylase RimI-like enzyme